MTYTSRCFAIAPSATSAVAATIVRAAGFIPWQIEKIPRMVVLKSAPSDLHQRRSAPRCDRASHSVRSVVPESSPRNGNVRLFVSVTV